MGQEAGAGLGTQETVPPGETPGETKGRKRHSWALGTSDKPGVQRPAALLGGFSCPRLCPHAGARMSQSSTQSWLPRWGSPGLRSTAVATEAQVGAPTGPKGQGGSDRGFRGTGRSSVASGSPSAQTTQVPSMLWDKGRAAQAQALATEPTHLQALTHASCAWPLGSVCNDMFLLAVVGYFGTGY